MHRLKGRYVWMNIKTHDWREDKKKLDANAIDSVLCYPTSHTADWSYPG